MSVTQQEQQKVVIVGGGITGMAAAYKIQEEALAKNLPVSFVLIEAGQQLGGKIVTDQVDDFLVEGGPDCFLRQKPWASELCLKLGLGDELMGTNDHQRKVYVINKGKLAALPDGVMLIVPTRIMPFVTSTLISWPGKIRMGMDWFIARRKGDDDESVGAFVRRRLGSEALEKIAEPLMSGIHVSDPEKQSLLGTFPRFRSIEKKHGSLIRGMLAERRNAKKSGGHGAGASGAPSKVPASIFVSLKGGLGRMVEVLEQKLTGGEIIRGLAVTQLARAESGGYRVRLENGQEIGADAVILAAPAFVSANLLEPIAPQAAKSLAEIRHVSTATISLAFRKADIRKPFMGFGFVVPKKEKRQISACTWTSFKFNHRAPEEYVLLRCFVGGPGHEDQVELSDTSMLDLVRSELKDILKLEAEPVMTRIYRWRSANPQYDVGHLDRVKAIQDRLLETPGLYATGGAFEGVGIPDCIRQGQETAVKTVAYLLDLQQVPAANPTN
jgi:protoporphyrinogen/coproporphyrinogen III oxidase